MATGGWRQVVRNPGGSIPEGALNKAIGLLAAALLLTIVLSTGFCSGEPDPAAEEAEADSVSAAAAAARTRAGQDQSEELLNTIDRTRSRIDAQQAALAEEQRLDALRRQQAEQRLMAEAAAGMRDPAAGMDPDLVELQRQALLEGAQRRLASLRSQPVALSLRSGSAGTAAVDDAAPAMAMPGGFPGPVAPDMPGLGIPGPVAGALDVPIPNTAALPEYENPPRLITPADHPGWERLYEGQWLEAVLVTRIEGEFPGPALAMVSVPFYSADRQRVLIPRGARLIGSYQPVRRVNQGALALSFHRLVLLDGRHVPLRFLGLDQGGAMGIADEVDRHYWSTFLGAGAVGILSGLALSRGSPYGGGFGGAAAMAGTGLAGSGGEVVTNRFLNRLPDITIRAGHRLRIWFTSDVLIPRPSAP